MREVKLGLVGRGIFFSSSTGELWQGRVCGSGEGVCSTSTPFLREGGGKLSGK